MHMSHKLTPKQKLGTLLIPRLPVTRENFDRIRFEMNAFRVKLNYAVNPLAMRNLSRVKKLKGISVNIGAGPFGTEGWTNIDMFKYKGVSLVYDCRQKMPFGNDSVERIRCEHVFEHLDRKDESPKFLQECRRVLIDGGTLRIVVPDLALFVNAYCSGSKERWSAIGFDLDNLPGGMETPMDILNHTFRQDGEHKFGYDFDTLHRTVAAAGFSRVEKMSWGVSLDPMLKADLPNHKPYSLYVDCIK
jgi:predicted SAM-dependent methyltransferase